MKQNTNSILKLDADRPSFRANRYIALAGTLLAALMATVASAQVTNNFTDGFGSDSTPLDQYPSAPGAGWGTAWASSGGSGAALTALVTNTSPLNSGGNYLQWNWIGGTAASTIRRPFTTNENIKILQPYVVEFDYRLDGWFQTNATPATNNSFSTFTSTSDYISFQQNTPLGADVQSKAGYWIKVQGTSGASQPGLVAQKWSFYDGPLSASSTESNGVYVSATTITFTTNVVYHFKIEVDPINRKYEATVSDGVNSYNTTAATGRKLNWRNPVPSDNDFVATTGLAFIARANTAGEFGVHSLDNLTINQVSQDLWPVQFTQINPVAKHSFYPASSNFVIQATTFGLTNRLPSSNTWLVLNGVTNFYTNLTFSGTDSDTNRTITFTNLQDNIAYDGTIYVGDQAGRVTPYSFFFDTFVGRLRYEFTPTTTNSYYDNSLTNTVVIIEAENFNFNPNTATYCDPINQTDARSDRFIQDWLYGGVCALQPSGFTNLVDSYYERGGVDGVDYFRVGVTNVAANFRDCTVRVRKQTSGSYIRTELKGLGITDEFYVDAITNGSWFNYTRDWGSNGNYIAYLQAGTAWPSTTSYSLDLVTTDYTVANQTTTNIGVFEMTNAPARREIIKWYPLRRSGTNVVLSLNGKQTLRLKCAIQPAQFDQTYINNMVFVKQPASAGLITITNAASNGTDFTFTFNTVDTVSYTVEAKTNLSDLSWTVVTNLLGTGGPVSITNALSEGSAFFRVKSP